MQSLALLVLLAWPAASLPAVDNALVAEGQLTEALVSDEACSGGTPGEGCDLSLRQLRGELRVVAAEEDSVESSQEDEEALQEPEYNCLTREVWSQAKQAWCCENKNLGCLQTSAPEENRTSKVHKIVVFNNLYCHAHHGAKELAPAEPLGLEACRHKCLTHRRCRGFTLSESECILLLTFHRKNCEVNHQYKTVLVRRTGTKKKRHHKKHPGAQKTVEQGA
eukprot:CAMPEP_0171108110 /NCGR_PEP_ID=MMETSP0766_2-20121228/68186_1 /TAXON_ID=439317 /ORGANISM="Gambierdiscus australes, Strain CAWD 149" /LENGTH=221 /DNA_ID=CAMNT_0011569549 /DNA_START=57 /DNA_END=722 /DNA_ORIENTATION=+